jgi:hypothetical protein
MSAEEEEKKVNTATQEIEEAEVKEDELEEESPPAFHEGADDELVGWLIVSDGEQIVVPHPEGKDKLEVVQEFAKARAKKHHAFTLGTAVFDPEAITTFAWSEDIQFPEVDKFDSVQERLELLTDAMTDLTRQQAALQDAHGMLIQGELEDMRAEAEAEAEEEEGFDPSPDDPEVLEADAPMPPTKPAKPARRGFRPPGA